MEKENKRTGASRLYLLAAALNALVFVLVAFSVGSYFFRRGEGNMQVVGARCFIYFTVDSNVLAALSCLAAVPFNLKSAKSGKDEMPAAVRVFKFVGAVAVAVTFFTVFLFLGPTLGYDMMFAGKSFYLHLICPYLCMILLPVCENGKKLPFFSTFAGVLPVVIYGIVYLTMVVFIGAKNGGWVDFYGFNIGGKWYLSYLVMLAASYLLSFMLYRIYGAFGSGEEKGKKKRQK